MSARNEILSRVRAAAAAAPTVPVPRSYRRHGARGRREVIALFGSRVADYRATVVHASANEVRSAIAATCAAAAGGNRFGIPPGLPEEWRPDALELVPDVGLTPQELDALDGVITGCTAAIAETGTIVLAAGPTEGRRALTLVPDVHVCVVREAQVVELVPEALALLDPRRPLTFVSGPSATSDIELNRVEGVHGPRTLVAIIVNEESR